MKIYLVMYFDSEFYADDCATKAVIYSEADVFAFVDKQKAEEKVIELNSLNDIDEEEETEFPYGYDILEVELI